MPFRNITANHSPSGNYSAIAYADAAQDDCISTNPDTLAYMDFFADKSGLSQRQSRMTKIVIVIVKTNAFTNQRAVINENTRARIK